MLGKCQAEMIGARWLEPAAPFEISKHQQGDGGHKEDYSEEAVFPLFAGDIIEIHTINAG
jgi:hypothetical protein